MEASKLLEEGVLMYRRARRGRRGRRKQPPMKPTMRFTALLSILIVSLAACFGMPKSTEPPKVGVEVLSTIMCATQDEKLSIAFTDQEAAHVYLDDLIKRLVAGDPQATKEAADIYARVQECL